MESSPPLPSDVQYRIGDTQDVFGPNMQCRVLMHDGREWGFLSDIVADCPKLFEVLKTHVKG